ncbi:hypothetical protein MMC13_002902 [Lambiella insularis]|nr:hypothetical protein [Lambiella insularis]
MGHAVVEAAIVVMCGTTSDFCEKGCQSNCVLNPAPPGGGAGQAILSNKVIAYYESWSARSNCHEIKPTDLPLDALTHINFAFAYIDPGSYEIVTMDTSTPSSLFSDITNVKSVKQDLSVFVSVGGCGGKYGLTFTTPSSYWYLRWFDLPNMIKHADWTNFMTYDLHGVWDATDPIGAIVQGHTNLTEIKLAAELFWRVGISPADLVLGFGFYGRSFTLADSSCTTPGCAFSGASNPGPCTATGGILGYYEILGILNQNPSITPVQDTTDTVMYFTFDKNQWVSFDNKDTFQQKVDCANGVGLGGAMIWASDLDDDKYSAHTALLGQNIISTNTLQMEDKALSNPQAVISSLASDNSQNCFAYKGKCVHIDDTNAMQAACGAGNTVVGWDDAGGVDSDCANAVCNATEVEVLRSGLGDDENVRCAYGRQQAACCSVQVAPVTPAICSYNLCRDSGFCTNHGTPGIAANKRDLSSLESESTQSVHLLEKRGQDHYVAHLPNGINFVIIAIIVDAIGSLFRGRNAGQVLRTQFRLRPGACIGPAIDLIPIPAGPNPPGLNGDQTEHPLEPQFSVTFFEAATSGLLRGTTPPPIDLASLNLYYIDSFWNHPLHNLGQYPAIGGPSGATPYTANDRMMGGFGSVDWPEPLMAVDQQINGPKGRMFKLNPPTSEDNLEALAETAVESDQQADADNLLSHIRSAFAIFEYMNIQEFITRWIQARNQVQTQLGYIQREFAANGWPIGTATQWWDIVLDDHLRRMEEYMINWMDDAIVDAFAAYLQANARLPGGQTLNTWPSVRNTLDQWRQMMNNNGQGLRFNQVLYSASIPLPQPPGGGGGGGGL